MEKMENKRQDVTAVAFDDSFTVQDLTVISDYLSVEYDILDVKHRGSRIMFFVSARGE